jgi:hypothetical protein
MAATPQSATIQVANLLISEANQIISLYNSHVALKAQWTEQGIANLLNALATAALNTDGSFGTADGSPNVAHPIDTRVAANAALTKSLSSNQLTSIKSLMDAIVSLIDANAVSAQTGAHGILNQAIGG